MKRRQRLQVSTFPFLAVLLCAMGSLILLLLIFDRQAKLAARKKALLAATQSVEEMKKRAAERQAEWARRRLELQQLLTRQRDALADQLRVTRGQADASTRTLSEEEARQRELNQRLEALRRALHQAQSEAQARSTRVGETARQEDATRDAPARQTAELEQLERTLKDLQELRRRQGQTWSLVPYRGKRGDNRRPLYLECTAGGVIFHPDRRALEGLSFSAERLRAEVERRLTQRRAQAPGAKEPEGQERSAYLMMLVRPDGISHYYQTTKALDGVKVDFGYEFVDGDWVLDFPEDESAPAQPWMTAGQGATPGMGGVGGGTGPGTSGQPGAAPGGSRGGGPLSGVPLGAGQGGRGPGHGGPGGQAGAPGALRAPGGSAGLPAGVAQGSSGLPGIRPGLPGVGSLPGGSGGALAGPGGSGKGLPAALARQGGGAGGTSAGGSGPKGSDAGLSADGPGGRGSGRAALPEGSAGASPSRQLPGEGTGRAQGGSVAEPKPGPGQGKTPGEESRSGKPGKPGAGDGPVGPMPPVLLPEESNSGEPIGSPVAGTPGAGRDGDGGAGESGKGQGPRLLQGGSGARPAATPPLPRLFGNRDWVIAVECHADAVVLKPWGYRFAVGGASGSRGEHPLVQKVRQLIERRQASVRPGEPPYRPLLRFQVRPDGLRAYYFAYPLLEPLRVPMSRESLE